MNYEQLLEDVRGGRRNIQNISHSCQGNAEITVTFQDGLAFFATSRQAEQLLDANKISQAVDLSFEDLVAALDGRMK